MNQNLEPHLQFSLVATSYYNRDQTHNKIKHHTAMQKQELDAQTLQMEQKLETRKKGNTLWRHGIWIPDISYKTSSHKHPLERTVSVND